MPHPPARDIVVVHSSDLHVDHDGTAGLGCVLGAARDLSADVVLLAGDTFDSHRVPQNLIEQAAAVIAAAALPVVILPGNHDPAIASAIYRDGPLAAVKNLHIIGVTHDDAIAFPDLSLEVWGRPHRDYDDMIPFATVRARRSRWLIAMAHGHYEPNPDRSIGPRPSWLIGDDEIAATGADYVALGHWNRAVRVGNGVVPAYYSGSPEYAGTINVVRLCDAGGVTVTRVPLDIAREVAD
jgi:DNA repair exonuclease SbcCD nuclease subunit